MITMEIKDNVIRTHRDLDVWRKSIDLVTFIYKYMEDYPTKDIYGLTSQIKRGAVFMPSNIAEDSVRATKNSF